MYLLSGITPTATRDGELIFHLQTRDAILRVHDIVIYRLPCQNVRSIHVTIAVTTAIAVTLVNIPRTEILRGNQGAIASAPVVTARNQCAIYSRVIVGQNVFRWKTGIRFSAFGEIESVFGREFQLNH